MWALSGEEGEGIADRGLRAGETGPRGAFSAPAPLRQSAFANRK